MRKRAVLILVLGCVSGTSLWVATTPAAAQRSTPSLEDIVRLERAALDRWVRLDPQGYLELYASEVAYFDPQREKRVDGLEAMKTLLEPIKNLKLPFTNPRYDMIAPHCKCMGMSRCSRSIW